jgi:hypothetical protein
MPRQFWNEAVVWATSSGTAVASTAAETIIFPDVTIFANYMQDGRCLRYRAIGQYSTTGTPTMIFSLRWSAIGSGPAGVLLCKTAACTTTSGIATGLWDLDVLIQTRTNGSTGTIMANGLLRLCAAAAGTVATATGEALVTPMTLGGATGAPGAATCDLTTDKALSLTLTWSASSASNTATGLNQIVEALN